LLQTDNAIDRSQNFALIHWFMFLCNLPSYAVGSNFILTSFFIVMHLHMKAVYTAKAAKTGETYT